MNAENMSPTEVMRRLAEAEHLIPQRDSNFYHSVKQQYLKKGISEKQLFWMRRLLTIHVLALESASPIPNEAQLSREQKPKISSWEQWNLKTLQDKIQQARAAGLKYPKIKLICDSPECGHREYQIYWSEYFGVTSVKLGTEFIFSILESGNLKPAARYAKLTPESEQKLIPHLSFLQTFNNDPTEGAKVQGRLTGACCFCQHELSTDESLSAGYGPVCAEHFGLPWGERTGASKEKEILLSNLDAGDDSIPF